MSRKIDLLHGTLIASQRVCLELWRKGSDPRALYPQNTFYRHRRALLQAVGVDIASPPPTEPVDLDDASLNPAGWDPEPIESRLVEPRDSVKDDYKLI